MLESLAGKKCSLNFFLMHPSLTKQRLYLWTAGWVSVSLGKDRPERLVKDNLILCQPVAFQMKLNLILDFEVVLAFH